MSLVLSLTDLPAVTHHSSLPIASKGCLSSFSLRQLTISIAPFQGDIDVHRQFSSFHQHRFESVPFHLAVLLFVASEGLCLGRGTGKDVDEVENIF